MHYKENKKSEETRTKEVLKDIKEAYETHEHKAFMASVYYPDNAPEIRKERYAMANELREVYKIIKQKGIKNLPKKADRDYYTNEVFKKKFTEV